jgi:hypothetical protein
MYADMKEVQIPRQIHSTSVQSKINIDSCMTDGSSPYIGYFIWRICENHHPNQGRQIIL